jgi:hypothetical protein
MPWHVPPFFLNPTRWSEPLPEVEATGIELASLGNEVRLLVPLSYKPRIILALGHGQ